MLDHEIADDPNLRKVNVARISSRLQIAATRLLVVSMILWFVTEGLYISPPVQFVLPASAAPVLERLLLPTRIFMLLSLALVVFLAIKENRARK